MRLARIIGGGLEDAPAKIGKRLSCVRRPMLLDTIGFQSEDLGDPGADEIRDDDKTGFVDPVDEETHLLGADDRRMPGSIFAVETGFRGVAEVPFR